MDINSNQHYFGHFAIILTGMPTGKNPKYSKENG